MVAQQGQIWPFKLRRIVRNMRAKGGRLEKKGCDRRQKCQVLHNERRGLVNQKAASRIIAQFDQYRIERRDARNDRHTPTASSGSLYQSGRYAIEHERVTRRQPRDRTFVCYLLDDRVGHIAIIISPRSILLVERSKANTLGAKVVGQ
jgi:hypothetical protein